MNTKRRPFLAGMALVGWAYVRIGRATPVGVPRHRRRAIAWHKERRRPGEHSVYVLAPSGDWGVFAPFRKRRPLTCARPCPRGPDCGVCRLLAMWRGGAAKMRRGGAQHVASPHAFTESEALRVLRNVFGLEDS